MGSPLLFQPQGYVPSRATEYGGRLSFTPETSVGGVATPPRGSRGNLEQIRHSRGRPVCFRVHNTLPSLVLSVRDESDGTGCLGTSMATSAPLCLPAISTDRVNSTQSSEGEPQTPAGCPKLARETLVSSNVQAARRRSMVPAGEAGPALTAGGPHLAPQTRVPAAMGLALVGPDPLIMECDQEVVQTIMDSRAPSTRALYANRWKIFAKWCEVQKEVPECSSVPMILRFLQSLLERKLSASTLRVYVAAISSRHIKVDSRTVGSHSLVTRFLKKEPSGGTPHGLSRFPHGTYLWYLEPSVSPRWSPWTRRH